jgi:dTDP-4-amino-4,6-dideoxygalactose transaminase
MNKKIDFLDLKKITKIHLDELKNKISNVLDSGWYILGEEVENFEISYSKFSNTSYTIGVANGLDALILSLKSLGIGPEDEVIVPSNTYIATWLAITHVGAKIIPVEPRIDTYNINCDLVEKKISNKTKAILAVNLYGQSAELSKLNLIAKNNGIFLIEDNAQSQGAFCENKQTGSYGIVNGTSFYPGKNLGALGDAGAITTNDAEIYQKIKMLRNYGSQIKYYNEVLGYNSRLDEIQAAILNIKLNTLKSENNYRIKLANIYLKHLDGINDLILPKLAKNCTSVYHLFVIRTNKRDALQKFLSKNNIATMIHYPIPPHLQKAYKYLGYKTNDFPIAEEIASSCLSLPIGPHLSLNDVELVCNKIKLFFNI